jgi:2-polyprenyl-6-methoxyphenol hydroxylase-like FAD-dependent oxidoreductase
MVSGAGDDSAGGDEVTDVLIAGAGPTGLTLGIDLLRRGVSCRIMEKSPTFALGSRARGVSPRTQEIFASLGVLEPLRAFAEPYLPTRFYDRKNRVTGEKPASEPATPAAGVPFPNPMMVSQEKTDAVLRQRVCELGGTIELDCAITGFAQDDGGVTASVLRNGVGERIAARYLVGCDGGGSVVRKAAGITFTGETWEDAAMYLIANVSVRGIDPGCWHVWTDPEWGYVTLQPITSDGNWLFVATVAAPETAPTAESMQRIFEIRTQCRGLEFAELGWYSLYRRNLRMVDRYRAGRVFLAGDAAHVGVEHGMNIGIQEAWNLGWKVAAVLRGARETLLDTYQEERLPIARGILEATLNRDRGNSGGSAAAQSIKSAISGNQSANDPTQLSTSYRGSSLARDFDPVTPVRAGDRAPYAPGLFEILAGGKFAVLHFGDGPMESGSVAIHRVPSANTVTWRVYGVSDEALVLVRPDGYIAATATPGHAEMLFEHLRLFTGPPDA